MSPPRSTPSWDESIPCRLCKGEPTFVKREAHGRGHDMFRVRCTKCAAETIEYLTMTVAWMDWEDGLTKQEQSA